MADSATTFSLHCGVYS